MNLVTSKLRWILKAKDGTSAALQTLSSRVLILIVNIATGILTARMLGPTGRGEQAAMILWSVFIANAATLGIPSAIVYNFRRSPQEKSQFFLAALLLCIGLGTVGIFVGILGIPLWLAQYSAEVIRFGQWFTLNIPLALMLSVCLAALEAIDEFTLANKIRIYIPISTLIILIGFILTNSLTPASSGFAYVFAYLPIWIWLIHHLWQQFNPQWSGLIKSSRQLLHYGIRSYGVDLLTNLAQQSDQILVVGLLSARLMGMYVVALSLARMLGVFQASIITVLFPKAAARPIQEVLELTGRAARVSTAITFLTGGVLMLVGPILLRLLYGEEYVAAIEVLRLLIVETILSGSTLVLAQAFMALGRPGIITVLQGFGLSLSIPLLLALVPVYSLLGAGMALLASTLARLIFILICYPLVLKVLPPNLMLQRRDIQYLKEVVMNRR